MFLRASKVLRPLARIPQLRTLATASERVVPNDVVPLTEAHKAAVLATAPVLAKHGLDITTEMYKTMLGNNAELKNIFSHSAQTTGVQPIALAQSVHAYAANINDLTPLLPTVIRIAEKHAALGVQAEHYGTVAENLMAAIKTVLGDAFTPELQEAWYHAYWQLAKIFIEVESGMYAKAAWDGWKDFTITKHVDESGTIASFDLTPTDKSMLPLKPYKAGQFITVRVWVPELQCYQNRHYSLSDKNQEGHYRITVKREDGNAAKATPNGIVSTILHELPVGSTVQAAFPIGSFVLPDPAPKNIVLFSAGVGITPNLAILNAVSQEDPAHGPNVSWIQCTRNPAEHVFKKHVAEIADRSDGKVRTVAYYDGVDSVDASAGENIFAQRLNVKEMDRSLLPLDDADAAYFICGPDAFMKDVRRDLEELGVRPKQITIEAFRAGEL